MKRKIISILLAVLLILPVCMQNSVFAEGENYNLTAAQLTLGECLGVVLYTDIPSSAATSATLSINGRTKTLQPEIKDSKCVYRYQEIVPDELGMTIAVTAANINTSFTCKDIAVAVLNMDGLSAETYELVSDLLRYGDAAAQFRGTANDILSGNLGIHFVEKTLTCPEETDKAITGSSSNVALNGITYYFNNYNRLCLLLETGTPQKVSVSINGVSYSSSRLTEYENGKYYVYSEAIPARTLNSIVTATVMYEGSSVISVTYSPRSYANAIGSDPSASSTDKYLAYALYQYAKSAAAYAQAEGAGDQDPSVAEWLNADNNIYLQAVDKNTMDTVGISDSVKVLGNDLFTFSDDDDERLYYTHICGPYYTHAEAALVNTVFCFPKNTSIIDICDNYSYYVPDAADPSKIGSRADLHIADHKLYIQYTYAVYANDAFAGWGDSTPLLPVVTLNKNTYVLTQITDSVELVDGMEIYAQISQILPVSPATLDTPVISLGEYGIYFDNVDGATYYDIYRDGELLKSFPAAAESQSGVQRLTGTTWTLPSAVSRLSDHTYNIKVLYGANEYETLKFQSGQSYSPITSWNGSSWTSHYNSYAYIYLNSSQMYYRSSGGDSYYPDIPSTLSRTGSISLLVHGGTDVENSSLVGWFKSNGTMTESTNLVEFNEIGAGHYNVTVRARNDEAVSAHSNAVESSLSYSLSFSASVRMPCNITVHYLNGTTQTLSEGSNISSGTTYSNVIGITVPSEGKMYCTGATLTEGYTSLTSNLSCSSVVEGYPISITLSHGSHNGTKMCVKSNSSITYTLSANSGYNLPETITVTGASYTYNSSTGSLTISNPTGNVSVTGTCPVGANGFDVYIYAGMVDLNSDGYIWVSLDGGSTWYTIEPVDCGMGIASTNVPNSEILYDPPYEYEGFCVIHGVTSITIGRDPDAGSWAMTPYMNGTQVSFNTATGASAGMPQYRTVVYTLTDDVDISYSGSF